jgi:hypothetical protein
MTKFESGVKQIFASQENIYKVLSDPTYLERVKNLLPADKVKNLSFDAETITVDISPAGKITLHLVEKEPFKCVKYATISSPLPFTLWIQIVPVTDNESKMRLTIGMEVNPFMKAMVQKPLKEGIEKMADALAVIPYAQI